MNIKGSTVVVTGANRGIGQAIVKELLAQGAAKVYAGARDTSKLVAWSDDKRVVPLKMDLDDDAGIAAAAKTASDATILINNAGALEGGSQLSSPFEKMRREFMTNYFGTLRVIRAFVPVLEKHSPATIVNLLSVVSFVNIPGLGAYSASKAAAHSMTIGIRGELAKRGISVLGVYPGPVDTDMAKGIEMAKTSPADVAKAILAGIRENSAYIFPDPMAQQVYPGWKADHVAVENQFASMASE